jgi:hypothetical protein
VGKAVGRAAVQFAEAFLPERVAAVLSEAVSPKTA